jgi:DNA gyrase inhibitor GyrI
MSEFMKSDKRLDADINKAQTFEDLRALLENATVRSGIAERDPQTGQFVRRDPLISAAQTVAPAEEEVTKTEVIGGREFTFTGTAGDVAKAVADAYRVAEAVTEAAEAPAPITPRSVRAKTQAEREREICDRTELDLQFRRGELTTAEYLDRTNAIGEYLAEKGFDVQEAASRQFEQSWAQATESFLRDSPEGQSWKGGQKNLEIIGNLIQSHGLVDAQDKVAALRSLAREMREKGLEFDGDYTPQQVNEMTTSANPQEILEAWKQQQPDPETANQEFIRLHQGGRFFGK